MRKEPSMKRQYMHPTMKVVEIKRRHQMLASSPNARLDPNETVNPEEVE